MAIQLDLDTRDDGDVLRLSAPNGPEFTPLRAIFDGLASGEYREQEFVASSVDVRYEIRMSVCARRDECLVLAERTSPREIRWKMTRAGWEEALGLLEGLIDRGAGHQYFGTLGADPLVILISLGERAPHPRTAARGSMKG